MPIWCASWGHPAFHQKYKITIQRDITSWKGQQQSSTVISRMIRQPSAKRLPDNSTIFAAKATVTTLALDYYQRMGPVQHDVVVYFDSMSCLQGIESEDTENPLICHIINLLWLLSDKRHSHSFLETKPLWHWGKWKSRPASKIYPWPWHIPPDKCPRCSFEAFSKCPSRKLYRASRM